MEGRKETCGKVTRDKRKTGRRLAKTKRGEEEQRGGELNREKMKGERKSRRQKGREE